MKRLPAILMAVAVMVALPVMAHAQAAGAQTKPAPPPPPPQKTTLVMGTVTAVVPATLTVKGKDAEWAFTIDKDTTVTAQGATHKTLALKAEGKATTLVNFVKVGDQVTVSYHEVGATKHASSIRVTKPVK